MKRLAILLLATASGGCTPAPSSQPPPSSLEAPPPAEPPEGPPTPTGPPIYPDWKSELDIWAKTVLDRADGATVLRLKQETADVIKLLEARYQEACQHPPYVMVDYRRSLKERMAHESERMRLIEQRIQALGGQH